LGPTGFLNATASEFSGGNGVATYERYQELQRYVNWQPDDAARVQSASPFVKPLFPSLIDDFYREIENHPGARRVITGGEEQIARLKQSLTRWLDELFSGIYDTAYVERRWRVGFRHVEIGLDQVYTNTALSRLRSGILRGIAQNWQGSSAELILIRESVNRLLDLDLAIIEDAYQTEFHRRQAVAERLATIGKVAGGIAHELRNPLNVIKTSVYFLTHARNASPEKIRDHLERIERQVGAADRVITALNDFARLPVPELTRIDIATFLKDVLELTSLPTNVSVEWLVPTPSPLALGDRSQLHIVFSNLIRNARDAMPEGGTLTLGAREVADMVEVTVRDTGVGVKPEDLSRIFEPLYSTKAKGIGLGLSIANEIIGRHQGVLRAKSEVGAGSSFTVCLPGA
jgi:signal transduction histidine kinase